jgi:biotin carboxyl carrier protein
MFTNDRISAFQDMQPPIRKINLNAHESHNQPMHPGLTALDLSRLKAERERQQLEEIRKREQAKMYQQAQAAAIAQQQMQAQAQAHAQAQAQAHAQQQGGQPRGPIPQGITGQPMPGGVSIH